MRSLCEQFYQLRKTLGMHADSEQVDIDAVKYRRSHFILGFDTEKVFGASLSGYSSNVGDFLTLNLRMKGELQRSNVHVKCIIPFTMIRDCKYRT